MPYGVREEFVFERRQETPGHGMVPAVSFPAQALAHPLRREGGAVLRARRVGEIDRSSQQL